MKTGVVPMIVVENLAKKYGSVTAVDGLSMSLPPGQVHGLLGPNGAGKTTTVRILATLTRPTAGRASIGGYDVTAQPLQVKRQIGVVHQTLNFDPELTGRESIVVHGMLYGLSRRLIRSKAGELLEFADLVDAADRPVSTYSQGMKRRLSVARAMLHNPEVILLDEPTVGLDAHTRRRVWDLIRRLRDEGRTIILTTHYIEEAEVLADNAVIIDRGNMIAEGYPKALVATAGAVAVDYLGPSGTQTAFFGDRDHASRFVSTLELKARATIRHANLEDVFIRLTGRRVNPGGQEGGGMHEPGDGRHTARTHHS